jgi:hypothetical protein
VLGFDGSALSRITDGDTVRLRLTLTAPSHEPLPVAFSLGSDGPQVATCAIVQEGLACETGTFASFGWYWSSGSPASGRVTLQARAGEPALVFAEASLDVAPRPAVMVHGFSSTWEAWAN